jgi:hypothetical protein
MEKMPNGGFPPLKLIEGKKKVNINTRERLFSSTIRQLLIHKENIIAEKSKDTELEEIDSL